MDNGGVMRERAGRIDRRAFLRRAVAAVAVVGARPSRAAAEPPPETTTLRIVREPAICFAPQYAAEDLLKGEGFVDVEYVSMSPEPSRSIGERSSMMDG